MSATIETLMNSVVALLGASPPAHKYGGKHLFDTDDCPRVVWERLPSSFSDPPPHSQQNPRTLWNKGVQLAIHCWGVDEDTCDQMVDNEIVALDKLIHGAYRPTKLEQGAANEKWLARGHAQILTLTLNFKVLDQVVPTGKATTVEFESSPHTDGWMESGEE